MATALDTQASASTPTVSGAQPPTTSLEVPSPACNAGDLLVLCATGCAGATVAPATPSGWTALSAGGASLGVFTKTATGSEPASYTVTFGTACIAAGYVASYPPATVTSHSAAQSAANVLSYTPTAPTGVGTDQVVLMFAASMLSGAGGTFAASVYLGLPPSWTWEVPPLGPNLGPGVPAGVTMVCSAGLASFTGQPANPTLSGVQKAQFSVLFAVLTLTATEPAWLQVTAAATAVGGNVFDSFNKPNVGMAMTVTALSGAADVAAITAGGATVTASGAGGVAPLAITPKASGSLVYGALATSYNQNPISAPYTAAPGTVFSQSVSSGNSVANLATFRASGPTTAGSPLSLGATGPTATAQQTLTAMAEIPAAGTITEIATVTTGNDDDSIHPPATSDDPSLTSQNSALAYKDSTATKSVFLTVLPPAGTVLVAMVAWSGNTLATATNVTISDSAGLQWAKLAVITKPWPAYPGDPAGTFLVGGLSTGVWVAQYGTAVGGPPGVPTGLRVTGTTDTTISLAWAAPAQGPVTGYDVYVNGLQVQSPATTTATVTALSPGTTYSLTVDAYNASGHSSQSTALQAVTTGAPPPPPQSTGSGCLFGLRPVPATGISPETDFRNSVIARELLLGRKADIITTWRNWDPTTETTTAELQCIQGGRLPLLTWPLPANVPAGANAAITAGTYDAVIYGWGQAIAALGGQVLFRPMPDANADPNFGPAPATYVTSWQRIWTIIKGSAAQFAALSPACTAGPALSAANVDFVWAMAQRPTTAAGGNAWASYFPGAGYVDWIALDTYNLSPSTQTIDTLITTGDFVSTASSHNWYATYAGTQQPGGKEIPLMVSETGCREADDPGVTGQTFSKATWLAQAQALLPNYPAVSAVVYTDAVLPTGDWRLDTAPGPAVTSDNPAANPTLAAAIAWAGGPYVNRRMRVLTDGAANVYLVTDPPGN